MTVLIALEHPDTGERAIAADGRCTSGGRIVSEVQRKVVSIGGEAWLGISGHHLAIALLRDKLRDRQYPGGDAMSLELRAAIRDAQLWKWEEEDGAVSTVDFNAVLLGPDGAWSIGADLSAVLAPAGWPAIGGSGGLEAAGAALALIRSSGVSWRPSEVVREAVAVACAFDVGCGGEVYVETMARKSAARAA